MTCLIFSKIEAGKLRLRLTTFKIADLLNPIVGSFEAWVKSKGLTMRAELGSEPLEMEADFDRISQVITNLLGNALKFTPDGGTITISAERVAAQNPGEGEHIKFSIRDTGPGVPKADQERIFEQFGQAQTSRSSVVGGTGLGLSISKEIVHLHAGKIWVESAEGKGACFIFTIPTKGTTDSTSPKSL